MEEKTKKISKKDIIKYLEKQLRRARAELSVLEKRGANTTEINSLKASIQKYTKEINKLKDGLVEPPKSEHEYIKEELKRMGKVEIFNNMFALSEEEKELVKKLRLEYRAIQLNKPTFIIPKPDASDKKKIRLMLQHILHGEGEFALPKEKIKQQLRDITRTQGNRGISRYKGIHTQSQIKESLWKMNRTGKTQKNMKWGQYEKLENPLKLIEKVNAQRISKKPLEVILRFKEDVDKYRKEGTLKENLVALEERLEQIVDCESARITNRVAEMYAEQVGIETWVWGPSGSGTPRSEHAALYGVVSKIGETPGEEGLAVGAYLIMHKPQLKSKVERRKEELELKKIEIELEVVKKELKKSKENGNK
ncbi:UNVERIFIED_CONTAM: hypothetical protein PYX00_011152 [Menopon gallinae]|uniref:Uncharacterized protein n=1 Tax=Menopon gallinae TaxID=328185 RepID=A0AAW2H698_9NEOP